MEKYNKQGIYAGYDKNHKERDAKDYYATPTKEVENILNEIQLPFYKDETILEPCAGGGHMLQGILNNELVQFWNCNIIATDVQEREKVTNFPIEYGLQYDFLSDNYPYIKDIDWIIINPPYATIEPFVMKSLQIARKGVLMLARLQFLEGQARYDKILKDNPPDDVYIYVDRITCAKNGNFEEKAAAVQAYAWFYWNTDLNYCHDMPRLHWIRRVNKK